MERVVPWPRLEQHVFKLQKRIYRASQSRRTEAVTDSSELLINSRAAALLAVRRVTQDNRGKHTAGVDGLAWFDAGNGSTLPWNSWAARWTAKPQPVRRVWIPKPGKDENSLWASPPCGTGPAKRWPRWPWSRNGRLVRAEQLRLQTRTLMPRCGGGNL